MTDSKTPEWAKEEAEKVYASVCDAEPISSHCRSIISQALLSAYERGREWQPIETAPKDGTEILITTAGVGMLVRVGFWDEARDGVWSIWPGRARMIPTHWMPLPAPPAIRQLLEVKG